MRRMIHQHLQRSALGAPPMLYDAHLDEDSLSAFVEGRLSEAESTSVIPHLVACGFCRRITAQLVRLESEIGPVETGVPAVTDKEPSRIHGFLKDLAARVLPSSDDDAEAVFAYHAPAEDFRRKDEADAAAAKEPPVEEERAPDKGSEQESNE
jgi:hypothetical protein